MITLLEIEEVMFNLNLIKRRDTMRVMLSDVRIDNENLIREYEVFTFAKEEQETNLNYLHEEQIWVGYTNVQPQITKLLKLRDIEFEIDSVNEKGTITSIKFKLDSKQVSYTNKREKRELSEEQLEEMRERAKAMHKR